MPAAPADVRSILRGTFADIEVIARSTTARRALLRTLQEAEASLAKRLQVEAARFGGTTTRFSGAAAVAFHQQALLATQYVQKRLGGLTEKQAAAAVRQSLGRSVTLMTSLEKRFTGIARPLALREAAQLRAAGRRSYGLWARDFPTSVDRYGARMLGQIEGTIRQGIVQGLSMDEMVATLTGRGGPKGTVSMSAKVGPRGVIRLREEEIPEGLFVRHKYWAERIVRTETMRAYNGARQVSFEEMGKDDPSLKKKIIAVLDRRTAPDSIAVNGQVRPINGLFMDGAGREYLYPPARPNDRETTIPWRVDWEPQADHLDEFEKAVLGELSAEEEQALIDRIQGKGTKPPKPPRAKRPPKPPPPPATPPMQVPIPPPKLTNHERLSRMYLDDVRWRPEGTNVVAEAAGVDKGQASWVAGKWRADWFGKYGTQRGLVLHETVESAMDELRQALTIEARAAANLTAESGSIDDLQVALAAGDGASVRKHVRAVLRDAGVVPRDPMKNMSTAMKTDFPVSPGAEAVHSWDGAIGYKPGSLKNYAIDKNPSGGVGTIIHEELHGCTPFRTSGFYQGPGAAIEEATVEMAARKISGELLATKYADVYKQDLYRQGYGIVPGHVPKGYAYTPVIRQLETLLVDEAGLTAQTAYDLIAETGIRMRGPAALDALGASRGLEAPEDIVDLFLGHLDVDAKAKPRLRRRILAELRI